MIETVKKDIAGLIGIDLRNLQPNISYTVLESVQEDGYIRKRLYMILSQTQCRPIY